MKKELIKITRLEIETFTIIAQVDNIPHYLANDPNSCNVYKEVHFPEDIYDNVGEFWREKAEQ